MNGPPAFASPEVVLDTKNTPAAAQTPDSA